MKIAVLVFGIIGCIFAGAFVFGILTVTAVSDITQSINGENISMSDAGKRTGIAQNATNSIFARSTFTFIG